MKVYPKQLNGMFTAPEPEATFDVVNELDRVQLILQREIKNLLMASAQGKLLPAHSRDLVAYVKLLHELKQAQVEELANLKDEDLNKLTE